MTHPSRSFTKTDDDYENSEFLERQDSGEFFQLHFSSSNDAEAIKKSC